jgi:hypothetical protein
VVRLWPNEHGPGDPRQSVCHGDNRNISMHTRFELPDPGAECNLFPIGHCQNGPCTVDEQPSEIRIATLADPEQFRLPSCGMLSRHQAQPGRKVAPFSEGSTVSHGRNHSGRHQWPHAWDFDESVACHVPLNDPLDFAMDDLDLLFHSLPLPPELIEQSAHASPVRKALRQLRVHRSLTLVTYITVDFMIWRYQRAGYEIAIDWPKPCGAVV